MDKKTGMTYEEAKHWLIKGEFIKLPEWGGFWFMNLTTAETLVFTKDGDILNTPFEEFKRRKEWMLVEGTPAQKSLVLDYLNSKRELTFGQKAVGASFNLSKMPEVDNVKNQFAKMIDLLEETTMTTRLGAMLKTDAQLACVKASMSIVKLLTFEE